MMRIAIPVLSIAAFLITTKADSNYAQSNMRNQSSPEIWDFRERRQLGIPYSDVAKLRLASRKESYRVGEMISLDLALLNISKTDVYFHRLRGAQFSLEAVDRNGAEVRVTPSLVWSELVLPESYTLVTPGQIILGSVQLLAGCNVDGASEFESAQHKLDEDVRLRGQKYDEALFDRNLFVNWGDACLGIDGPGSYRVFIEISNRHVIASTRKSDRKTATGTLRSNPLEISISK